MPHVLVEKQLFQAGRGLAVVEQLEDPFRTHYFVQASLDCDKGAFVVLKSHTGCLDGPHQCFKCRKALSVAEVVRVLLVGFTDCRVAFRLASEPDSRIRDALGHDGAHEFGESLQEPTDTILECWSHQDGALENMGVVKSEII